MHFASKKVYAKTKPQRRSEAEVDQFVPPALNAFAPAPAPIPQANTNVVSIDLGELASKVDLLAGDAAPCQDCGAIFNSLSKTSLGRGGETQWTCEFCGNSNPLELEEEERPKSDTCDFILSPAIESKISDDAPTLLFVVDVSGSMCVTTELQGSIKLRGNNAQALASLNSGNINDQYLPGQRRDITYVSRLQCVQAAFENQLETLHKQYPKAKVGLVCFNNEVTIIGDGTSNPVTITGDKLFDYENLLQSGAQHSVKASLENSKDSLIHKVYKLEESGSTALGPAVTVAVGMCMNTPGSKIVLATDGLANTGVGTLDSTDNSATEFYSKLAHFAKEKAITISVIGIRGDTVGMNAIGKLADITTGDIDIVDPVNITKNFTSILEAKLVATNVEVKLFLHKGFQFPKDDNWVTKGLYASRSVGNAFSDSEITAQFEQKEELELSKVLESEGKEKEKEDDPTVLPFQVQITYTSLNGMKCLRVITKTKELTRDFAEVEKDLDVAVLGMHANDVIAQQAQQGNFFEAMNQQMAYGQLLDRNVKTDSEKAAFGNWSVGQQNVFAHQPGYSPQQFAYQQPQQSPQPSMNPYAAPPQSNPFSNFTFGSSAQPAQASSFAQPQQEESSPFASFKGFVNSFMQPSQPSVANNPMFQQQQQEELDDATSNAVYQHRNCRKNKQQWGGERKY